MSYSVDANLLIHAANTSSPFHKKAKDFLMDRVVNPEPLCLTWGVLSAFLRITTHIHIFPNPLTPLEAAQSIEALLSLPQTKILVEEEGFWKIYAELNQTFSPRGKAVPDMHLAALLKFHDIGRLYTHDGDFQKFDLKIINPLA